MATFDIRRLLHAFVIHGNFTFQIELFFIL